MFTIEYSKFEDIEEILSIDTNIPRHELEKKVKTRPEEIYVLKEQGTTVGILRYGIFWDYIPHACFLFVAGRYRGKGYAQRALAHWEEEMKQAGWPLVIASISTDDPAQHFYRKMGYTETGCLILNLKPYAKPMEIFFIKSLEA